MIIVRAWPQHPPAGRPHIMDGWPKVAVDDYDYRGLLALGADVISMDWDTACSREGIYAFAEHAADEPSWPMIAPMRTYYGPRPGQWNIADNDGHLLPEGTLIAPVAGFGMVYLPHQLLQDFAAERPGERLIDPVFCSWHYQATGRGVRVDWSVRPVHLHYPEAITGQLPALEASHAA